MLNRRELIASSVALSLTAPGASARLATGPHVPHFLAASGFVAARDAAARAAALGERIVWIGQDLTPAYTWLDLALRAQPFPVAGLTSARDFFVLERLAWDRGLRTVARRAIGPGNDQTSAVEWRLEPRTRR